MKKHLGKILIALLAVAALLASLAGCADDEGIKEAGAEKTEVSDITAFANRLEAAKNFTYEVECKVDGITSLALLIKSGESKLYQKSVVEGDTDEVYFAVIDGNEWSYGYYDYDAKWYYESSDATEVLKAMNKIKRTIVNTLKADNFVYSEDSKAFVVKSAVVDLKDMFPEIDHVLDFTMVLKESSLIIVASYPDGRIWTMTISGIDTTEINIPEATLRE